MWQPMKPSVRSPALACLLPSLTLLLAATGCLNGNIERDDEAVMESPEPTPSPSTPTTADAPEGSGGAPSEMPVGDDFATDDTVVEPVPEPMVEPVAAPVEPSPDDVSTSDGGTVPAAADGSVAPVDVSDGGALPGDGGAPAADDASVPPPPLFLADGGPLTGCNAGCAPAGGVCVDDVCVIDCEGRDCDRVECPNDYACEVTCGDGQCTGGVVCPDSDSLACEVDCAGQG